MGERAAGHDLDAAGITEPALRTSYERCRRLHALHGRTYYLATLLLPPPKRPYVWALYGFARYADEIVDDLASTLSPAEKAAHLRNWGERFLTDLRVGASEDPICRAVVHTARTWDIPVEYFEAFLASMRRDLSVVDYPTYADLQRYMYGSASVIGLQMIRILEPLEPEAFPRARALGEAFQLSNFIRDVGEDLDRGRVYLPAEDLARARVTRADLERRVVTDGVRELLRYEIARTRQLYDYAEPGIAMLAPSSRECIRAAYLLYGGILGAVERADYRVLDGRPRVGPARRARVALPAYVRARRSWSVAPVPAVQLG